MKLRCLLIDDEPPALKILQSYIAQIESMEVVGLCSNAVEAIQVMRSKTVDVMFLDIKMPKILGTDFLRSLSHPPKIVFVTAYRNYAVEGFELDAVDYLIKPVSFERFLKAVDRLTRSGHTHTTDETVYESNPNAFVYLKSDRVMQKVFVNEILYIESWRDYVKLYLTNSRQLLVKQPISAMENLLSAHKFLRVHRSYIISASKITGYNNLSVRVQSVDVPMGRLYKQSVINKLNAE